MDADASAHDAAMSLIRISPKPAPAGDHPPRILALFQIGQLGLIRRLVEIL